MSWPIYPSNLLGLKFDNKKIPVWQTNVRQAANGKEVRRTNWTYPRYKFQLSYEFLRDNVNNEFQTLIGFCNTMQGQFSPFWYSDPIDNTVAAQTIGIGDGTTKQFALVRTYGGYIEPVAAANAITAVYKNGVALTPTTDWVASLSGVGFGGNNAVTLTAAPANGDVITADFSFYYACRFTQDEFEFNQMMLNFFDLQQIEFMSIK